MMAKRFFYFYAGIFWLALLPACGKKSNPVAPNAEMFGTWNGTLDITWVTGPTQNEITVILGEGAVAYYQSGTQYPAALTSMSDPNVSFTVNLNGVTPAPFTGSRSGHTLQGTMSVPAASAVGTWATTHAHHGTARAARPRTAGDVGPTWGQREAPQPATAAPQYRQGAGAAT